MPASDSVIRFTYTTFVVAGVVHGLIGTTPLATEYVMSAGVTPLYPPSVALYAPYVMSPVRPDGIASILVIV